ncbi:hypothetical protein ABTD43_18755, partial [Acinetobacter baumannii]
MKALRLVLACAWAAGLGACGGGSAPPPPEPQPQLTLTTAAIKEDLALGDELILNVDGRWSYAGTGTVYLQLR